MSQRYSRSASVLKDYRLFGTHHCFSGVTLELWQKLSDPRSFLVRRPLPADSIEAGIHASNAAQLGWHRCLIETKAIILPGTDIFSIFGSPSSPSSSYSSDSSSTDSPDEEGSLITEYGNGGSLHDMIISAHIAYIGGSAGMLAVDTQDAPGEPFHPGPMAPPPLAPIPGFETFPPPAGTGELIPGRFWWFVVANVLSAALHMQNRGLDHPNLTLRNVVFVVDPKDTSNIPEVKLIDFSGMEPVVPHDMARRSNAVIRFAGLLREEVVCGSVRFAPKEEESDEADVDEFRAFLGFLEIASVKEVEETYLPLALLRSSIYREGDPTPLDLAHTTLIIPRAAADYFRDVVDDPAGRGGFVPIEGLVELSTTELPSGSQPSGSQPGQPQS